ncbi:MAG: Fe(2+)-trafficking protein [Chloroflexaceae bacterium]|nr:Fe(2+)-trafficking protein [Chloroflexaceae bacterium]
MSDTWQAAAQATGSTVPDLMTKHNRNHCSPHARPSPRLHLFSCLLPHLAALVVYSALAGFATWPLLPHLSTHFPAIPGELSQDVWQHAWNLWWVQQALLVEHTNPYHTTALFYPQGASLYLHSLNLPLGLMGIPLLALFGIVITYNLLTLLVLVLSSYSTFLLAWRISGHAPASVVAGAIVLCSPQRLMELRGAQLATLSDYGVPLAVLAVLVALQHRTWRMAALAAGALLLTGLSKWYHLFHALLVLLPLLDGTPCGIGSGAGDRPCGNT